MYSLDFNSCYCLLDKQPVAGIFSHYTTYSCAIYDAQSISDPPIVSQWDLDPSFHLAILETNISFF